MKRRLFSKRDGSTFLEDISAISEDFKNFFNALPVKLKAWIYEAEILVNAVEALDKALQDGQPADTAIDFILSNIKGDADEKIYEAVKDALSSLADWINEGDSISGGEKSIVVRDGLALLSDLPESDCNLLTELAVYSMKN